MQWQTVAEARAKDAWERKACAQDARPDEQREREQVGFPGVDPG
jgi:hypothetical protein